MSHFPSSRLFALAWVLCCFSMTMYCFEIGWVKIPFSIVTKNDYWLSVISLGTPYQQISLVLDIGSERTWIHQSVFTSGNSSSFISQNYYDTKEQAEFIIKGLWGKDRIDLVDASLTDFDFLWVNTIKAKNPNKPNEIFGAMSLGKEYDTNKFSIVRRLTEAAETFFNSFSIEFTSHTNGNWYIGDVNPVVQEESYIAHKCQLSSSVHKVKWSCLLTDIFIGEIKDNVYKVNEAKENIYEIQQENESISVDKAVYFETIFNKIILPLDSEAYLKYLDDKYFINDQGEKLCKKTSESGRFYYTCSSEEINKIKPLSFVYDGSVAFVYQPSDLFKCIAGTCEFLIEANSNTNKDDWFIMGIPALRKYNTEFNYNSKELKFYSKDIKSKALVHIAKSSESSGFWKNVFLFLLVVAICGSLGVAAIYFLRKKNFYKKNIEQEIYQQF